MSKSKSSSSSQSSSRSARNLVVSDIKVFNPDWIKTVDSVPPGGVQFFGYDRASGKDKSVKAGVHRTVNNQYIISSVEEINSDEQA